MGTYTYNNDSASKENHSSSSSAFQIRDGEERFVYVETRKVEDCSIIMDEVVATRMSLEHYISDNLLPVILETDSLILKKIFDLFLKFNWAIATEITKIRMMMNSNEVGVEHTLREGNQLIDFFH